MREGCEETKTGVEIGLESELGEAKEQILKFSGEMVEDWKLSQLKEKHEEGEEGKRWLHRAGSWMWPVSK